MSCGELSCNQSVNICMCIIKNLFCYNINVIYLIAIKILHTNRFLHWWSLAMFDCLIWLYLTFVYTHHAIGCLGLETGEGIVVNWSTFEVMLVNTLRLGYYRSNVDTLKVSFWIYKGNLLNSRNYDSMRTGRFWLIWARPYVTVS